MGLSWPHILIALLVFALLFGTGKISALMGDVAKGIKSFKKGMAEDDDAQRRIAEERPLDARPIPAPPPAEPAVPPVQTQTAAPDPDRPA